MRATSLPQRSLEEIADDLVTALWGDIPPEAAAPDRDFIGDRDKIYEALAEVARGTWHSLPQTSQERERVTNDTSRLREALKEVIAVLREETADYPRETDFYQKYEAMLNV